MNCHKVEIIVITCKDSSYFILSEIRTSWCKQMISKLHSVIKDVFIEPHTYRSHFSNSFTRSKHHVSPSIHCLSPMREVFRDYLIVLRLSISWSLSNIPKESPFGVKGRRTFRKRLVLVIIVSESFTMISCSFNILRGSSYLVVFFRMNLWHFLSIIEIVSSSSKIFLNHLAILFVVFLIYMSVFQDDNSIQM